jgi:predicted membrane GTPase involved in stress response
MIIGEHTRENDLEVNVLKGKQLTNIRTTSRTKRSSLTPPIRMTLERALAYIEDDELVEVTPKSIRLRNERTRFNTLIDEGYRSLEEEGSVSAEDVIADLRQIIIDAERR